LHSGTWQASWRYRIYGVVLDSAGADPVAVRYRWTGLEFNQETGLHCVRARYYDPALQRFIQEDPIGYAGGLNLYGYGDGNPTNGRDPDGLMATVDRWGPDPSDSCKLHLEACGGDGGGGRWRRGAAWEAWTDMGGAIGFAILTTFERNCTGDLEFTSDEEERVYLELKRKAYETGSSPLQDMLEAGGPEGAGGCRGGWRRGRCCGNRPSNRPEKTRSILICAC